MQPDQIGSEGVFRLLLAQIQNTNQSMNANLNNTPVKNNIDIITTGCWATFHFVTKTLRCALVAGSVLAALLLSGMVTKADVTGDYRSAASGNWDVAATWETYNGATWATAGSKPTSANHVFIQAGHVVTLTANEACNDLHISTGTANATTGGDGQVALATYKSTVVSYHPN